MPARSKRGFPRRVQRTRGGLTAKLHAVCHAGGKPWIFLLTENQVGDYRGANAMLPDLPEAGAPMPS